jgi:hypothetical protein
VTTRAELVDNLGPPLFELGNPHVVAYTWGKVRPTGVKPAASVQGMGPSDQVGYAARQPAVEEGALVESRRWIYCVALDDQNRVVRSETVKMEGENSLESAVRRWAASPPGGNRQK